MFKEKYKTKNAYVHVNTLEAYQLALLEVVNPKDGTWKSQRGKEQHKR